MITTITPTLLNLLVLSSILIPSSLSCPTHQKQSLLDFKATLTAIFNSNSDPNSPDYVPFEELDSWTPGTSCCTILQYLDSTFRDHFARTTRYLDELLGCFNGSIPSEFYRLKSLRYLDMSNNLLEGELGSEVGAFHDLTTLRLGVNQFNGSIPLQLFELVSLRLLDLSNNSFAVCLSSEVGKLGNLETLLLNENFLTGNVPNEIGNLTRLREFSVEKNLFSGRFPSSIGNMKELESLDLSENSFSGQIPVRIGELWNVTKLDLSKNQFTGPIPSSIRNLTKLETFRLKNNQLEGIIPTWLFKIKTLKILFIGGNKGNNVTWNNKAKIVPRCSLKQISMPNCQISGQIPKWISSQKALIFLDLSDNQLEGRFPDWLSKMDVGSIILSDNKLTGSLPSRLFESVSLSILALSRNNFSGELPKNLGNARAIMILMLSGNNLSGRIPVSISNIYRLLLLDLSRNKFSGDRFPVFGDNPLLAYIDLSYNEFSGTIPSSFSTETRILSLGGNMFSGDLPQNLTNLVNLEHLDLHDNNITGNFQDVLPQTPNLQVLSLRNNSFKGFIPKTISNLTSLHILDLSGNNLMGSVPPEIGNLTRMINSPVTLASEYTYIFNVFIEFYLELKDVIEFQDLILNWKNSLQGLSSRRLDIYSFLDLSENRISGEIPASVGNLESLKLLNISHNNFFGQIPVSFGNLKGIESLDLSHNKLSGKIPQSLAKLKQLAILDVSDNRLTGKIPLGRQMDTMNDLNFFANNSGLCGMQIRVACPEDIKPSDVKEAKDENRLSWISWEGTWFGFLIGFFSSILIMDYTLNFLQLFKKNQISRQNSSVSRQSRRHKGKIPQSLAKLKQLAILDVSDNSLTGKIPLGGQMDTMNDLNYFANNCGLCGMQIRVICPENIQPSDVKEVEDANRMSWISWEGTCFGFPVGFFSSILIMGYTLNFLQLFKGW
ncbi:leucine-rich repeat-containing protein [Tanacetum coccineum]